MHAHAIPQRMKAPLLPAASTWPRLVLVAICISIGALNHTLWWVAPCALLVLALDLVAGWLLENNPHRGPGVHPALLLEVVAAVVLGVAIAPDMTAPGLLPLLILPAFRAGEYAGRLFGVSLVALCCLLIFGLGRVDGKPPGPPAIDTAILWLGLALVVTLAGAWLRGIEAAQAQAQPRAAQEAAALLRRLDTLADAMDGGFDAPASAELMLRELAASVTVRRAAVLVGSAADPAVPLAVRGCERVPWPDPSKDHSPLHDVWRAGASLVTTWSVEDVQRSVLAVPLLDADGAQIGALVADREAALPFTRQDLAEMEQVAYTYGGNVDVALSFAALREHAGMEERERLAREMHDGIAQELVALGYRIDIVRRQAKAHAPHVTEPLDEVRADLTQVLADLRLRIADLRLAVRPDRGLGAVIGDRLQRFGATSNLSVTLRLNETGFRLPAHTETALYRLFLHVLEDARHAPGATAVEVTLTVAAPQAFLRISHDGESDLLPERLAENPLSPVGGEVIVDQLPRGGVVVQAYLHRSAISGPRPLTREKMPQRS